MATLQVVILVDNTESVRSINGEHRFDGINAVFFILKDIAMENKEMINCALPRCIIIVCFLLEVVWNGYFTNTNLTTERYVREKGIIKLNIIDRLNVMKQKMWFLHLKSFIANETS